MKLPALTIAASILLTSGCAGFKASDLPTVSNASYSVQNEKPVKVFSTWQARAGSNVPKGHFDSAIRSSGCCEIVDSAEQADVIVNGVVVVEGTPGAGILGMISGFTFGVIPAWATQDLSLRVTATESEQQHRYTLSDSATLVIWLPMLLVMPFRDNPLNIEQEVTQNTYRTLVARMKNDGLLSN